MGQELEIEMALGRTGLYQLLSSAFLSPDEEFYLSLKSGEFIQQARGCLPSILGPSQENKNQLRERLDSLEAWLKDEFPRVCLADIQAEFTRVFGHTISKECPPYETQYGSNHIFQQTQGLADIAGFYRAFGLEVSQEVKERPDHVSLELEFMYFLAYKEAYARSNHGPEEMDICRKAQESFLREHLGRWAPVFVRLLARKAEHGFYKELADLTAAFLDSEVKALGVKPVHLTEDDLIFLEGEPEEACFSCTMEERE